MADIMKGGTVDEEFILARIIFVCTYATRYNCNVYIPQGIEEKIERVLTTVRHHLLLITDVR